MNPFVQRDVLLSEPRVVLSEPRVVLVEGVKLLLLSQEGRLQGLPQREDGVWPLVVESL